MFTPVLYAQMATINGVPGEIVVNKTPEGCLRRNFGPDFKPGEVVGVYELKRVVAVRIGVVEIANDQPAAPSTDGAQASQ